MFCGIFCLARESNPNWLSRFIPTHLFLVLILFINFVNRSVLNSLVFWISSIIGCWADSVIVDGSTNQEASAMKSGTALCQEKSKRCRWITGEIPGGLSEWDRFPRHWSCQPAEDGSLPLCRAVTDLGAADRSLPARRVMTRLPSTPHFHQSPWGGIVNFSNRVIKVLHDSISYAARTYRKRGRVIV